MGLLGSPVHDSSEALVSRPGPTRWTALPGHRNSNDQQVDPSLTPPPSHLDTAVKPTASFTKWASPYNYRGTPRRYSLAGSHRRYGTCWLASGDTIPM